jgi:hypothetical protein
MAWKIEITPEEWALISKGAGAVKWLGGLALSVTQIINFYNSLKGKKNEKSNSKVPGKTVSGGRNSWGRFLRK